MTYEYNLISYERSTSKSSLLEKFNSLGAEGWELVAVYGVESKAMGLFDSGSETNEIVAVFKRAKP
ncbi:MAG: DUF4177 domain-containing protein [Sphingobacteriaceae bacterium]|nr:DUF4177 domain-containing protein [Cytophagaceae bacterium]